jgi:predicted membrane channel-forming protein YqfA (hemolysin III family)
MQIFDTPSKTKLFAPKWPQQPRRVFVSAARVGWRALAMRAVYHQPVQSDYRLGDILANAITHGVGAAFALAGTVYLISASMRGTIWQAASCAVFASTLVLVYLCSTLYHSLVRTRARHLFRILDHSSIYLLIAGTYTPFALVSLRGPVGWLLFGVV